MKQQCYNPYLPSWEYIPDAEPRLFDGRLYIFGSHDPKKCTDMVGMRVRQYPDIHMVSALSKHFLHIRSIFLVSAVHHDHLSLITHDSIE